MDVHYSAFISYRHHPQDTKVAEEIQRRLEHYRVPAALKKQGKKIDRLFRDKDELPITSSLTDTITLALENSDYLIVICSSHLKESYWCQREIETFLKTHTKDQILTVLVDGENPYDVIPEILTYNEVVDPVTGQTKREPLEPLSCDWRMPQKQAVRDELPRLAAVLLGCSYDELKQRQRQYRMRRLVTMFTAGLCASLALAGYFLYSSIQIQKNLTESLKNQSQYLASASMQNLSDGDRLTAIALALEALPKEGDDRPYVAYAEQALADALSLYDASEQVISVAVFDAEASISDFVVTDDAQTLYILDDRGIVTAWDTFSFEKLASFGIGGTRDKLMTNSEGNLLVLCSDVDQTLRCFDRNGNALWHLDQCEDTALCVGKETLLIIRSESETNADFTVNYKHYLLRVNPESGQLLEEPIYLFDSSTGNYLDLESDTYYDGQPLYISVALKGNRVRYLLDLKSGDMVPILSDNERVYCASTTENSRLFVLVSDGSGSMNGRWMNMTVYGPAGAMLYCFDSISGQLLWSTELETYMFSHHYTIAEMAGSGNIICQYGNTYCQLDSSTGEILTMCMAPGAPLTTEVEDTYLWCLFADGSAGSYYYEDNQISAIQYLDKTLNQGCINRGLYTYAQLDTRVVLYRSTADESYEQFTGTYDGYISETRIYGDYMVAVDSYNIYMLNLATREMLWTRELGDLGRLIGFTTDGTGIVCCNSQLQVSKLDVATGEVSMWVLPGAGSETFSIKHNSVQVTPSGLTYIVSDHEKNQESIAFYDMETDQLEVYPFLAEEEAAKGITYSQFYVDYVSDRYALILTPEMNLYQLDRSSGQSRLLLEDQPNWPVFLMDEENATLTVAVDQQIRVFGAGGEVVQIIELPGVAAVSFCRHNGELLAVCDDANLYRFDEAGQQLSVTALSIFDSFYVKIDSMRYYQPGITWDFAPDGELILNLFQMGNIIHPEQWIRIGNVGDLLTYHAETDSFICKSGQQFYGYQRCNLEDMIRKAKDLLGSFELSERQKTDYGLD